MLPGSTGCGLGSHWTKLQSERNKPQSFNPILAYDPSRPSTHHHGDNCVAAVLRVGWDLKSTLSVLIPKTGVGQVALIQEP